TAVKPPKRFTSPLTASTLRCSAGSKSALLVAVSGAFRQWQHGLALGLTLGPYHVRFVVDVLNHNWERALVLARHRRSFAEELDAKAQQRPALGNVGVERRLTQRVGINAAIFLDSSRQYIIQEHIGVRSGDADMRRSHRHPWLQFIEFL